MGRRNQERRRVKKKQREARERARRAARITASPGALRPRVPTAAPAPASAAPASPAPAPAPAPAPLPAQATAPRIDARLGAALTAVSTASGDAERERALDASAALFEEDGAGRAALAAGGAVLHVLWDRGWEPADVVRVAGRELRVRHARITADLLAAEHRAHPPAEASGRWLSAVPEPWWGTDEEWAAAAAKREKCTPAELGRAVVELLQLLATLPPVPALGAPDLPELPDIWGLLLDAEEAESPAEAERLTAGAVRAAADRPAAPDEFPVGIRLPITAPHEAAKARLAESVAAATRCVTARSRELGCVTVVGFPGDVAAVEQLHASLWTQAQAALRDAESRTADRPRTFRATFLADYADRAERRLTAAAADTRPRSPEVAAMAAALLGAPVPS